MRTTLGSPMAELEVILVKEKETGCRDTAVDSGLDKYLLGWVKGTVTTLDDPAQRRALTSVANLLTGYSRLSLEDREIRVSRALERLKSMPVEWEGSASSPPSEKTERLPSARRPSDATSAQKATQVFSELKASVTRLRGIDKAQSAKLARLGVETIEDLLYLFPRRYLDYRKVKKIRELLPGEIETVVGTIWEVHSRRTRSQRSVILAIVGDETGTIEATWFRAGREYFSDTLKAGQQIALSGRVENRFGHKILVSPDWEIVTASDLVHTGRLVPVYPLTEGLSGRWLRRQVKGVVAGWISRVPDHLPPYLLQRHKLLELRQALTQIHFPDSVELLSQAQRRLAFDELLCLQLALMLRRHSYRASQPANPMPLTKPLLDSFLNTITFRLTSGQEQSIGEILDDMAQATPMARLLQGEVGSGKTVVATVAALAAVANGFQAVMMAPTEILAEQHCRTMSDLFSRFAMKETLANSQRLDGQISIAFLTGSLGEGGKRQVKDAIASGIAQVVIGTHALIEEGVEFHRLGLVIVDEQHRFGVLQRATLRQKGYNPHILVMTATPIPRTLALTLYADLDISTIKELPSGRQEVVTKVLQPYQRERAYQFVRQRVAEGEQAFIVCPLIEESEKTDAKAATVEYHRLSAEVFPELRVGLLHGRMRPSEKEAVMVAMRDGQLDILVSTTVIEVGIDIPNATVMLVEGADRFGLAQLHQLRGRVGRGEKRGYCLLVAESPSADAKARLSVVERSHNGFDLAQKDLEIRGPGEFLGVRQSGFPDLRIASIGDLPLIEETRKAALNLLDKDPSLQAPQHALLLHRIGQFSVGGDWVS